MRGKSRRSGRLGSLLGSTFLESVLPEIRLLASPFPESALLESVLVDSTLRDSDLLASVLRESVLDSGLRDSAPVASGATDSTRLGSVLGGSALGGSALGGSALLDSVFPLLSARAIRLGPTAKTAARGRTEKIRNIMGKAALSYSKARKE
jgi:hypothetical protein